MKFAFNRSASLNSLVLAGLLATAGAGAMAQTPPPAPAGSPPVAGKPAGHHGDRMARHDPAKMQAWIAKRQAELKAKLKITPAQEGAWTSYTASMQPPARGARPTPEQRAEFDKLTTPQRIDKMKEMRTQRMAEMNAAMDKRGEATKTFYAALTPEQQKTFDTEHKKFGRHHGGGPRGHGGPAPQKG
ncbi:LTXXQ motif family protein [Polaromonas sp. YR568]|uniref:Spy/CpxP family protein refolding chaperone n=1 Tax=Polaromonas sp. YR568 TaxID=1855301 RepID=UPI0008EDE9EF|nr:Spy/CpxP family protein refolding chaperone [Polaromonas sp. YR568]SFU72209.1 LTXXQ motif family protein [Polaromonas sp. YR568]